MKEVKKRKKKKSLRGFLGEEHSSEVEVCLKCWKQPGGTKGRSRRVGGEVRGWAAWREVEWGLESQKLSPPKGREPSVDFEQLSLTFS